jgi:hypothetical protein
MKKKLSWLIVILALPACFSLFHKGFFPTQDYIYVARIYEMDKALKDGQFPVRWVPDFRYGEPLFNFYAPLPYYMGSVVHTLGFSFLETTKILYGLGFLLSGLTMFLLAKEVFGKWGGIISSVFYIYAPYHSVDVYVRGALSESWALIFFPLIFLFALKLSKVKSINNLFGLALSLAGLFFTHNIMTILFTPFFLLFCLFLLFQTRDKGLVKYLFGGIVLGFGLGASFLLPAFFEKDLVQSSKLITGYFDFRGHFVEIRQFAQVFWGYGASLFGNEDGMSFQVGVVHLAGLVLSVIALFIKKIRVKKVIPLVLFLSLEFMLSLFMQHNKSTPIWLLFPILAFTQFPWRFLGVSIFLLSFAVGSLGLYRQKGVILAVAFLTAAAMLFNLQFFHPDSFYEHYTDDSMLNPKILGTDDKLPKDYLPIYVRVIDSQKLTEPSVLSGKAEISDYSKRSASAEFNSSVSELANVEIPISYFPGWKVFSSGKELSLKEPTVRGLIQVELPEGQNQVSVKFTNTPIRSLGNSLTLLSALIIGVFWLRRRIKVAKS